MTNIGGSPWGTTFWHDTSDGESGEGLVPLAIQTTRSERAAMGFDEAGYQEMRDECARANPGCGEPLLVLESTGEIVDGSEVDGALGTVSLRQVWEAGVDIGDRVRGLPHEMYQHHCEERDLAIVSSSASSLSLLCDMTFSRAVELLHRTVESELARDTSLGKDLRSAALRQVGREAARLKTSSYAFLSLETLMRDAWEYWEHGAWSALEISPDRVAEVLWHDERFRNMNITEDNLEEIARNACDNLAGNGLLAEIAGDQVLAEASVTLGEDPQGGPNRPLSPPNPLTVGSDVTRTVPLSSREDR
ncbi:hypothetical protein [Thermophilibacter mediterraneus]|uniref:hypothetical protein n=1 Tax=Thermophilibacter mediterraneus TaxID=1871031 RepID=UPI0023549C53|nr:hypothetical protein [Thermophilibacter mediterraneus]